MTSTHNTGFSLCLSCVTELSLPACVITLFFFAAALQAQDLAEGKNLYDVQCQACHGEDAHGSDRAPELAGSRRLRSRNFRCATTAPVATNPSNDAAIKNRARQPWTSVSESL